MTETVAAPALLAPGTLAGVVARYGATLGGGDARAVLSRWSQYYLLALMPGAVADALGARERDVGLAAARVTLSSEACPVAVACAAGRACGGHPLTPLLRDHLVPLSACLAACGLREPVFWSNAGFVVAWALREAGAAPGLVAAVQDPCWADGAANPMAVACRAGCAGCRAVCCLRHRLPGIGRCATCPVLRPRG